MSLGWKIFLGTLAVVGGGTYFLLRKNKPLSFEKYCENCINEATKELKYLESSIKTILVLAKTNESDVAPFLYRKHPDGKITKKRVNYKTFPFDLCPSNVQDSISKGEYIIQKF